MIGSEASARPARGAFAGLVARARAWRNDASHNSIAQKVAGSAFLIRMISAALVFGSQILFARWMGSFEFGIYVYVFSWVLVVGEFADLGLASAAQRFIPQYSNAKSVALLRGFICHGRWLTVGAASLIAVGGAFAVKLAEPVLANYVVLPLMIACVALPFYALMQLQDGIARSYNWVQLALLPMYVIRHIVLLAMVAAAYIFNFPTDAVTVVAALTISLAVTAVGQTFVLNRRVRHEIGSGSRATEINTWFAVSLPMLMVGGFYLLLTHTDILVLQQFRSPDDVATYYAASKTIALVSFVYFAVSAAVAHRFTEYHVTGDRQRLAEFLADSIRWTFWPSAAATAAILLLGKPLLALFGPVFVEGFQAMIILAAGLLARAAIGPVERLLTMLGEQRICAAVYAFAFATNLVLCILLIPRLGIEGAAISTTTALVGESVLLFYVTRKRLKLHAFIWGRPRAQ
ncbi:MAG: lipopolysaccharide biosynthesis protein [Pseudoxanthomonas sp.]